MAQQNLNLGTRGDNQTGDDLNEAGVKIQANFTELYTSKLESVVGGTNTTIDNTDPLNPIINVTVPNTISNTSDLINDGSDGTSTYVENDEIGNLAALNTVGTSQINNSSITLVKMANANAFTILGNANGTATVPQYLTTSEVRSLLNVEDGAAANQTLSLSGSDLTISGGNTITLPTAGGVVVDSIITDGSTNPVTNNAIHDALFDINSFVSLNNIESDKIQDGPGSGLNADLLDNYQSSNLGAGDTIALRTSTGDLIVADEIYGINWNGSLEVPTKNAVYDKIESLGTPNLATVLISGNSAGSSSLNMSGQAITNVSNIGVSGSSTFGGNIGATTVTVNDDTYDSGWNGSLQVPTKNAIYDKIESLNIFTETNGTSSPTPNVTNGAWTVDSCNIHYTIKDNTATVNVYIIVDANWAQAAFGTMTVSLPFSLRSGITSMSLAAYGSSTVSAGESLTGYVTGSTLYITYSRNQVGTETWINSSIVISGTVLI